MKRNKSNSSLKTILVVDSHAGNCLAAAAEDDHARQYGYRFLAASSVEHAAKLLKGEDIFGIIACLDIGVTGNRAGLDLVQRARKCGVRSLVIATDGSRLSDEELNLLKSNGVYPLCNRGSMGGYRWSPDEGKLIKGGYDFSNNPSKWRAVDGRDRSDLQSVRSWFGLMMHAPRESRNDPFPNFPRDGDEERRIAYLETLG